MVRPCHSTRLRRIEVPFVGFVSLLVLSLVPMACRQTKTHARAAEVDSKNLKQTVVVATLDCPLPEHKNAIWCSTFQMAWDKLKQDIIGEPIQVLGAEELADRLNRSQFPTGSIEEKSYYATAGFVKKGITKQVQKEMKQRFPSEPVPTFNNTYKTLPDVVLAYAYLNVNVGFQFPYYADPNALNFQDSAGAHTGVTAFCVRGGMGVWGYENMRDQVEVLHYDDSQAPDALQFAVDLSQQTQPYEVILARVPPYPTLGEAAKALQEKIAGFKNDPDYEVLRRLRSIDTLAVPDVACDLAHHFDELLRGNLANRGWQLYRIFEAVQRIEFTLNRTGVLLKSEARLRPATRSASQLAKRRHLHFDRPFLICVRKREPNATPFFLMWVDNAELMKPYGSNEKGN